SKVHAPEYGMLVDWGLALDGLGRTDEGIAKLMQAASLERTAHVYSQICMLYGKQSKWDQALPPCLEAIKIDPTFAMSYVYVGQIYFLQHDYPRAIEYYEKALQAEPTNQQAREGYQNAMSYLVRPPK